MNRLFLHCCMLTLFLSMLLLPGPGFADRNVADPAETAPASSSPADTALPENTLWIDVRSADEYAAGHLPGARLIPHEQIVAGASWLDIPKDQPIALYCGSGRRAGLAREAMLTAGYQNVINVGGLQDALQQTGAVAVAGEAEDTEPSDQAE